MCMIAYAPAGAGTLTPSVITTAMTRHPDGFGLMWRDTSGESPVVRTARYAPSEKAQFRATLDSVRQSGDEYAVHFRMGTSGPNNADMAHPFVYTSPSGEQVAVMHNGIINISHDRAKESDTAAFVRLVLAQMPDAWWTSPALVYLVREAIGYSKLTIMTASGTFIVGEEKGEWHDGIWYSSDHLPYSYSYKGSTSTSKYTADDIALFGSKAKMSADPNSKRSQKRAAKAALRTRKGGRTAAVNTESAKVTNIPLERSLTVPAVTPESAYESDFALERLGQYRHLGHNVSALVELPLDVDEDYTAAVMCNECQTIGDVYVIDGSRFIDLGHYAYGMDVPSNADSFAPAESAGVA